MSFKKKIKTSKFIFSLIFLIGYAAYSAYAVYYYLTYRSALGIVLLCLIGVALALSVFVTFLSYRINLKNAPRPKLHRFIKMAKYFVQLVCSVTALGMVLSAVQNTNAFSLVMACISIPFLLWSLCVNLLAEYFERKFAAGFGKRVFVRVPAKDEEGNELDLEKTIAAVDGRRAADAFRPQKPRR